MPRDGWETVGGGRRDDDRVTELERRVSDLERDRAAVSAVGRVAMVAGAVLMAVWSIGTWIWDKVHR